MRNLETYDGKHQNPRPIQSVTYLRNYQATDLWKKKQTLLVAARRETSKIAQPKYQDRYQSLGKALLRYCGVVVYNPEVVYERQIVTGCQASKLDSDVSTQDTESSNDLFAYRNCTHRSQPLCKTCSDDQRTPQKVLLVSKDLKQK